MNKKTFDNFGELADYMYDSACDGNTVYTVLFYEDAVELMRELVCDDSIMPTNINIAEEYFDGYDKEYYITLGKDLELYIERAWQEKNEYHEAGYAYFEADELLISGDASYSIVKVQGNANCDVSEIVVFESLDFNSDDECCDDENCDCKRNKNKELFEDIVNFLEFLFSPEYDDQKEDEKCEDEVVEFISRRFPYDVSWVSENCYYFAKILEDRFPGGDIYYDVINGHFSYKYKGKHYDHTGLIIPDGELVKWDSFDEYDSIQKKRIIRDCLM